MIFNFFNLSNFLVSRCVRDLTIEFGDLTIESHASSWLESWMNVGFTIQVMNLIHPSFGEKIANDVVGILDEFWIHHTSDESHPSKLGGKIC